MARNSGGTPKARALGAELREIRENAGFTLRAVARELETNHVKVQRYETGATVPNPELVAAYLGALGVSAAERERLIEMARDADQPDWLSTGSSGPRKELTTLIEFERSARRITDVATGVIPGLLQTSDYARAIMRMLPVDEREQRVLMRIGRREILTTRNAPHFVAIITESVLDDPIGGREVMVEQLRHLAKMADADNIEIRILRSGATMWHPAHMGSFILFEFPKATPIVHMEQYHSSVSLHTPGNAHAYQEAVTNLHEVAMSPDASVEFIASRADEMEDDSNDGTS
ncbi:helix-turn-helix domain-containing protein [Actinopolyspora sp. H202]|uniref:helix-turn-helix domain-containing protein n=1 Tax=Actinopolyspora sp. H202 TaxID=1500456 RepID=UPI003EE7A872